jgi:hypothetical protein
LGHYSEDKNGYNPTIKFSLDGNKQEDFSYVFYIAENNKVKYIFHIYDTSTNSSTEPTLFHHLKLEQGAWATPWD